MQNNAFREVDSMKKTIGVIMLIIIINCFVIVGSAGESVENELLAVLNDLGTKRKSLVEADYPEGIFDDYYTYEMRIDSPDILAEETRDGKIYARRVNPERLMSFFKTCLKLAYLCLKLTFHTKIFKNL